HDALPIFSVDLLCVPQLIQLQSQVSEVGQRLDIIRLGSQDFAIVSKSFPRFAQSVESIGEIDRRVRVVHPLFSAGDKNINCFGKAICVKEHARPIEVRIEQGYVQRGDSFESVCCLQ